VKRKDEKGSALQLDEVVGDNVDLESISLAEIRKLDSQVLRQAIEKVRNPEPGPAAMHQKHHSHDKSFHKGIL
jgi:hypothetical protein